MKKALVTGATRVAGCAIAIALAEFGWQTYARGRDESVLEELRAVFGIQLLAMDLTDRDDLRAIASNMKLDAVVHAALRWPHEGLFVETEETEIDMALEVNLSATLHLTHAILPSIIANGHGDIVLVSLSVDSGRCLVRDAIGAAISTYAILPKRLAMVASSVNAKAHSC